MSNMDNVKILEKILKSEAKNYLESYERLLLMNIIPKLEKEGFEPSPDENHLVNQIIRKYSRFLE